MKGKNWGFVNSSDHMNVALPEIFEGKPLSKSWDEGLQGMYSYVVNEKFFQMLSSYQTTSR